MGSETERVANVADLRVPDSRRELKRNCLSYIEVLSQSISVIAPSTVPAVLLGLIFAAAGNGTWLSFLLGMIGMVLVSYNINQFARRSASPGSLYNYIVKGLGPTAGVLGGWALLFGYILTGMSTLCGFGIIAGLLLDQMGIHAPTLLVFGVASILAFFIAYKDIQLSAKMMLACEGLALIAILILGLLIWQNKGFALDTAQMTLKGATPGGVLTGIVLVVFGFSGFESATSLGAEAKDPLHTIPRSVMQSVLVAGVVFIFMAYVVILGFEGSSAPLEKTDAPLNYLAESMGWGILSTPINIGILLSFFSCTLASINSTARIVFSMAQHGLFSDALGESHEKNKTPYYAVALCALITFLVPSATVYILGIGLLDSQGYFGTLCSFGFLLVYILVSLAAPFYLRDVAKAGAKAWIPAALAIGFLLLPFVGTVGIPGSTLFPPAEFPNNLLLLGFVFYMAVGLGWLLLQKFRHPKLISSMKLAIDSGDLRLAHSTVPERSA